ncbi:MAG: aspartate aminotransferase family protein [gamma proteobacterium symbiont of Bathyaustriella thionipta]|nr:aspartate aminotransferase family protein [gamma proteobacterium symbiont of Bathyaustriella thionipta]MCU7949838.1 aspartate aminotransferase family protein [gamma proteobacterium symbiont of Bathyaustriella thionipta]MCU7954090.1 aspartate aminotransferase family protein [gamma proteobacterium symbiont of Bathyaustriella thionipta]MCU7956412.1 aspartate aminotransferase family protein [gamma proteobacterium symbiont of Bathyaustriella thionipta]MCU7966703.1 aspartate aminotransferase famil
MSDHIMNTYGRLPVSFVKGDGCYLYDEQGQRYLDALTGIAVCGLGHSHPAVAKAISEQASTLMHTSNLYGIPNQETLADKLCELSAMDRVFFSNSGAEANEAAIKIVRRYGHTQDIDLPTIIVANKSFHGRTLSTLSATGNAKVQAGFEPLVPGFIHVDYNDMDAIRQVANNNANIVAIMVEPIQGEGGLATPADSYLKEIRTFCDENNFLMILDEIQTGICRTGKWFAGQHSDIIPDVMTLAKGLGNGFPIGACLAKGTAAEILVPGTHGSTFGGNPLACAAALATIHTLQEEKLDQRAAELGDYFQQGFKTALATLIAQDKILDIRGKGLMIGIELDRPCTELIKKALDNKLLINVTADSVVRLLPALITTNAQADEIISIVSDLIIAHTRT